MSLTGVVVPGSPQSPGGTLLSDVLSTDTVLPLNDAADFAEDFDEARYLVIGDETTPREYVAVQNDEDAPPESVTLAVAVGGSGLEAGLPVTPWDPNADATDKRAVNYRVWVRLDGFAEDASPVPAWVEQNRVPTASDYILEGARVELSEDDDGDFWIERVLGRAPVVNGELVNLDGLTVNNVTVQTAEAPAPRVALIDPNGEQPGILWAGGDTTGLYEAKLDEAEDSFTLAHSPSGIGLSISPNDTIPLIIGGDTNFNGNVDISSLANSASRNASTGSKYVRADADGALYASTTAPSSRLVKHDIVDLDVDPEAVLGLRPVTFRYNDDPDKVRVGFIAEEADELGLRCLVGYEDHEDASRPTGFDYDGLGAALLAVAKRQQAHIIDLEARLAALEE